MALNPFKPTHSYTYFWKLDKILYNPALNMQRGVAHISVTSEEAFNTAALKTDENFTG